MITYRYLCNSCSNEYEIQQRIIEKPISLCPSCGQQSCERIIFEPYVIDLTPKTVGGLADKNTKKMGSYERDFREQKRIKDKEAAVNELTKNAKKPFYHNKSEASTKEIRKMTEKQKQKYIIEGKK